MLRDYQIDMINRVKKSWATGHRRPCVVAPCGSGKTLMASELAKKTTDNGNRVLFVVHREELRRQTIDTFAGYGVNMDLCSVGMVQTLTRRDIPAPKLIVVDEAHHIYANSYVNILNKCTNAYVVGLTATPQRLNGGGLGKINDDLIIGPSVSELIGQNHLAPFKYYSHISADTSKLQVKRGEFVATEVNAMMSQDVIYGNAVENYIKYNCRKCIVYCSSIKNSMATAAAFLKAGITAVHVDGETPSKQRENIMEDFKAGKIAVLCNVDLVSEGFDCPDCDSCILLRPTMSLTLHIQQSMRPMRYIPNKTAVIIDQVENYKRHGLPDTPREWTLDYKKQKKKEEKTRVCDCCYSVYDMKTIYCEPCNWDMRLSECEDCDMEQQYGRGSCIYCGGELIRGNPRRDKGWEESELEEIKSFTFKPWRECKSTAELIAIQKANGYRDGWVYYKARELKLI